MRSLPGIDWFAFVNMNSLLDWVFLQDFHKGKMISMRSSYQLFISKKKAQALGLRLLPANFWNSRIKTSLSVVPILLNLCIKSWSSSMSTSILKDWIYLLSWWGSNLSDPILRLYTECQKHWFQNKNINSVPPIATQSTPEMISKLSIWRHLQILRMRILPIMQYGRAKVKIFVWWRHWRAVFNHQKQASVLICFHLLWDFLTNNSDF